MGAILVEDILNDSGKLIFVVLSLLIVIEAIAGIILLAKAKKFKANSQITTANVISKVKKYSNDSTYLYEVAYKDRIGRRYKSNIGVAEEKNEGDDIEVVYDKDNPEKVKPNNNLQIFIFPMAMLSGVFCMIIVLVLLLHNGVAKTPF